MYKIDHKDWHGSTSII